MKPPLAPGATSRHLRVPARASLGVLLLLAGFLNLSVPGPSRVVADPPTPEADPVKIANAQALYAHGESLYEQHDLQGALAEFSEAEAAFRLADDGDGQLISLIRLVIVHVDLGRYEDAVPIAERQLALVQGVPEQEIDTILTIASLNSLLGDTSQAFSLYDQALELARGPGLRAKEGAALLRIGGGYQTVGQFEKAIDYLQKAREIFKEANDKYWQSATVTSLITGYIVLERYPEALALESDALALAKGDSVREARTLLTIGAIYSNRGVSERSAADFDKALEYYNRADVIASQIEDPAYRLGFRYDVLASIGSTEMRQARHAPGATEVQQARWASALGNLEGALDLAQFGPRYDPPLLRNIAYANESLGRVDVALEFYDRSIKAGEQLREASQLEAFRQNIAELYGESYGRLAMLRFRLGQESEAFDLSEQARARTFLDLMGSKRLDIGEKADTELAQREKSLRDELRALEEAKRNLVGSFDDEINAKRRELEEVLTQLKLANPEYHALVTAETLPLSGVQEKLDDQTTLVSYFVTPDDALAFVVTGQSFEAVALGVGEEELYGAIKAFRDSEALKDEDPRELRQFYDWLVRPILPFLNTPRVGIIPFGDLHYLPFAPMTDGEEFLGDSHVIFYLPSASALPFVQGKRKEAAGPVLAMSYGLKYGTEEVETIGKIYGVGPELADDATESLVRAEAGRSGVLHLASHGELLETTPLFSRMRLAGDEENDGDLAVHEVYGLDLQATDMVVLSACQTQVGALVGGDDVIGLTRAFIYAGSPTVVASLWNVDDKATSVFMRAFYQSLRDGKTKGEALQAAQEETRGIYPQPYYWAAFVLTGDPGPVAVELGSGTGSGLWLEAIAGAAGAAVVCASAALWLHRRRVLRRRGAASDTATGGEGT